MINSKAIKETITCPECDGEVQVGKMLCPHCGADIQEEMDEYINEKEYINRLDEICANDNEVKNMIKTIKRKRIATEFIVITNTIIFSALLIIISLKMIEYAIMLGVVFVGMSIISIICILSKSSKQKKLNILLLERYNLE